MSSQAYPTQKEESIFSEQTNLLFSLALAPSLRQVFDPLALQVFWCLGNVVLGHPWAMGEIRCLILFLWPL